MARARLRILLVAVAVLAAVVAVTEVLLRAAYSGQALPGTSVAGVEVAGMDEESLRAHLKETDPTRRTLIAFDGDRALRLTGRSAGIRLRAGATARQALAAGRDGPLGGLGAGLSGIVSARTVDPVLAIDPEGLDAAVARLARRIDQAPFPGGLDIDSSSLAVRSVPPRPGRRLDQDATASVLRDAFSHREPASVELPVREQPAPPANEVETVARAARRYLQAPLELRGHGRTVAVAPESLARGLTIGTTGAGEAGLTLRSGFVERLTGRVAKWRDRKPRNAVISAPQATQVLDEKLDAAWRPRPADVSLRRGATGRRLDRAGAASAITDAVRTGAHATRVPVTRPQPSTPTAAVRDVRSLIGGFTTYFVCCEPRVTNISQMAKAVDGTVVGPGETFSLNETVGPRTRAKGYLPAPFISDGEIVPSVGGGVSQFSTTLYNAAYFAGLQIDTHQPHSFFIDRYPPGREATLDFATIDLRWTNDTAAPVLIRAATTDTSVSVSLYGNNGGRRVRASSGARTSPQGKDFAVTVTRIVRFPDGRVSREPFTTTYDKPPA